MSDKVDFLKILDDAQARVPLHPGEILFEKGDRATNAYIIVSGQMEIYDGDTVFEVVGPGDILGEMALIDPAPRSASVRAVSECEIAPIDARRFITMVERTPTFAIRVMRVLARRLRWMDERDNESRRAK
jgi:CRP-like cAMP-binding protein